MSIKVKLYNVTICILSIVSVIIAVIDFTNGLNQYEIFADKTIYFIFVIDYIVRLVLSDDKKDFVKNNIFDIIAIIPFNSAFRIFRFLKVSRVLRFTKLFRIGSLTARSLTKTKRFLNTNGFKYVLCLAAVSIILSSFAMMYFEQMPFEDSLWWAFVTTTTVGYGDLSPTTGAGRIIASILMLVGIGLIGSLTSSITSFFLYQESENPLNSDKIEMVMALYEKLTDEERRIFKNIITTNDKEEK